MYLVGVELSVNSSSPIRSSSSNMNIYMIRNQKGHEFQQSMVGSTIQSGRIALWLLFLCASVLMFYKSLLNASINMQYASEDSVNFSCFNRFTVPRVTFITCYKVILIFNAPQRNSYFRNT
jgi:hypothetical protein